MVRWAEAVLPATSFAVTVSLCLPNDSRNVATYVALLALIVVRVARCPLTVTTVGRPLAPSDTEPLTVVRWPWTTAPGFGEVIDGARTISFVAVRASARASAVVTPWLTAKPTNALPPAGTFKE